STPYVPSAEYWQMIRKACDKHGALLIFDEIPHALCRTGKMFTCENFNVTPDILCIGKGLGGGVFPLAAMIASERLDVVGHRALGHYTHEKSPVACAAAMATINYIESNDLLAHSKKLGRYALDRLKVMKANHALIGDVRGIGLFLGIELIKDGKHALDEAEEVMYCALSKGISFKLTMGNIITLTPALTITKKEMDQALDTIEECIKQIESVAF
ncbi:MAG: aminotransferase class III-fold pyridoxal phosphate-dependent enzyme, partial [Deltaproteobacteria bacterium]|nr:aminotransferase class III-fold pyridoxal phosphate-dependent enzyme [Deltaproteobacteria bacterium]